MKSWPNQDVVEAYRICSRCIYDSRLSGIDFDSEGVCNYCHQIGDLAKLYGTGTATGLGKLEEIVLEIKRAGRRTRYDCIVGVSGGTDSSYILMWAVKAGLRPLAVHYDNTWNAALASMNIRRVTDSLGIDLHTVVVDNIEVDDIKRSFLLAGVREFDADTDIAFVQVLRATAAKFRVKYILEGHSFVAEGLTPVNQNYLDGAYVKNVHERFGKLPLRTFPILTFWGFLKWAVLYRQKFIRPLWYLNYSKEAAKVELQEKTGWLDYGGHHLENRASAFAHKIYLPQKFRIDYRFLSIAAQVRNGLVSRERGLTEYQTKIPEDKLLKSYVLRRLNLSDEEFDEALAGEKRDWTEFKTYKRRFEILRPLFFLLAKADLVPRSFYLKYCFPHKSSDS